jgi:hypothetical protein
MVTDYTPRVGDRVHIVVEGTVARRHVNVSGQPGFELESGIFYNDIPSGDVVWIGKIGAEPRCDCTVHLSDKDGLNWGVQCENLAGHNGTHTAGHQGTLYTWTPIR